MKCLAQVEVDPYCLTVLYNHWPEVPKYGDVSHLSGSALPPADAICGGFPCQPVSLAGRREGQGDTRWLWPEFARLVDEVRPRYVIVENVPGVYTLGGSEIVSDLATMGYDAEWGCVPAEAFGAPHKRERFVLVAHTSRHRRRQDPRGTHGHESKDAGGTQAQADEPGRDGAGSGGGHLAHPDTVGRNGWTGDLGQDGRREPSHERLLRDPESWDNHWLIDPADDPESGVGRVAHGVSNRMDRVRTLGNSVVPQVFEWVGQAVMADARKRGYV